MGWKENVPALTQLWQPHRGPQHQLTKQDNHSPHDTPIRPWWGSSGKDSKENKTIDSCSLSDFLTEANKTNSQNENKTQVAAETTGFFLAGRGTYDDSWQKNMEIRYIKQEEKRYHPNPAQAFS